MATTERIDFLRTNIEREIKDFEAARTENRDRAQRSAILTTLFSGLTTVLIGLNGLDGMISTWVKNFSLVTSMSVTLVSMWDGFFNHRKLWIIYTNTVNQLKLLQSDLDFLLLGCTVETEAIEKLYQRYRAIREETYNEWMQMRSTGDARQQGS